jgi:hypothetical protein
VAASIKSHYSWNFYNKEFNMQKTIQFLFLFSSAMLSACGGGDSDPPTLPPGGGTPQTVKQIYEAMDPLCGPVAMAIGLTSNETQLTNRGPTLWDTPEEKPASFVGLYYLDGWPTTLLKTAQLGAVGGGYNYFKEEIVATSEDAADMCDAVHGIIFPTIDVTTDRHAYSNILFYLSGFDTPSEPWNGEIGSEVFDADIEMVLSYATAVPVLDSNNNVNWHNADIQHLSMKVECDQPFQVEQVLKGISFNTPESVDLSLEFCDIKQNFFSCLGLKGVYSGNQCTYVVEDQHYTPVNSSEELTVSFGGTITLAPEKDWPGRPAYQMTIDRFKL